ncbi:hypothetical protein A3Q56_04309 [Intoshia linei]|uniref:Uncharacterized protein n=1 Tax=Intoshia linei TaxID=1819745 RepID=A0A177B168_9BILA|nr:hypothetical protein A3Q56_04309 [Intoshia linei]
MNEIIKIRYARKRYLLNNVYLASDCVHPSNNIWKNDSCIKIMKQIINKRFQRLDLNEKEFYQNINEIKTVCKFLINEHTLPIQIEMNSDSPPQLPPKDPYNLVETFIHDTSKLSIFKNIKKTQLHEVHNIIVKQHLKINLKSPLKPFPNRSIAQNIINILSEKIQLLTLLTPKIKDLYITHGRGIVTFYFEYPKGVEMFIKNQFLPSYFYYIDLSHFIQYDLACDNKKKSDAFFKVNVSKSKLFMIEITANDRLGKKVRVKCK